MSASPSPQRGVVLVADDDPVMRLLMLEMLQQVGLDGMKPRTDARHWRWRASTGPT